MPTKAPAVTVDPVLDPLNERQKEAVLQSQGPLLVLAGAGSGKTRALTHRIARLIQQGVPPWQILSVTFTNKAAKEMKDRIKALLHVVAGTEDRIEFGSGTMPVMGTFHSVCVRILRRDIEQLGRDRRFVIYDQDDQERMLKEILKEMRIDEKDLRPRPVLSAIGRFKSEAIGPKQASAEATTDRMHTIVQAYHRYEDALKTANALDFDDLILETVRLFHECPHVLDRYQETWRYLHVDEYQDTNHAQYLLITMLAQKYRNLCVIGDPDQAIYGFRGADIRNILHFREEYPEAVHVALEQNYRSVQPILTAADAVIAVNPNRPDKKMWTKRTGGDAVQVFEVEDERAEAQEAVRAVQRLHTDGLALRDQVVLYRTHAQSRQIEEACMRAGVPYRILGGVKFYGRREVKDVLAYLHVLLNPYDTLSLLRIINVPSRKIGDTTLGRLQEHSTAQKMALWDVLRAAEEVVTLEEPVRNRLSSFVAMIEKNRESMHGIPVSQLAQNILHDTGMEKWLRDGTDEGEERWQNVLELLSVMQKYDPLAPMLSLTSFLEEVALVSEVDKLTEDTDALTLMTLHLCKGLEFEHVIIAGCEEGIFPHNSSLFDKEQLEEERRIMYVGMTRAKSHLQLLFARSRLLWGERRTNAPSRFLDDLPDGVTDRKSDSILSAYGWAQRERDKGHGTTGGGKLKGGQRAMKDGRDLSVEFNQDIGEEGASQEAIDAGTRVQHPSFGTGTVTVRRGGVVDVQFDSGVKKTFAMSIAPLKPL